MSILKRALIQVRGNIGKTLLLVIIFIMTMGAVSASFIVTRAYDKTIADTFKDGEVPIYVRPDEKESITGSVSYSSEDEIPTITYEQYQQIGKLDGVASSKTVISSMLTSGQLELPSDFEGGDDQYMFTVMYEDDLKNLDSYYGADGYTFDVDTQAFKSNPNSIIINDEVLAANNLEVGDKITLDLNSEYTPDVKTELENQELTIVGSYTSKPTQAMIDEENKYASEDPGYEPDLSFNYLKTRIIMPYAKGLEVLKIIDYNQEAVDSWTTFNLSSLDVKDQFEADAEALVGMPLDVEFEFNEDGDNAAAESLYKITYFKGMLSRLVRFAVMVILVLLTVIITMFIRGRKKEIGILVALGESKRKIYGQLLIEQFIILGVAILVEYPFVLLYLNSMADENSLATLGFDLLPLGQSIAVGVIIVGLITIIPAIYTLRVKPKKILL